MRSVLWFAWLVWACLGCEPTQGYGPSLEIATADDNPWPVCISQQMQARASACPDVSREPAFETRRCIPRAPERWPPPLPPDETAPDGDLAAARRAQQRVLRRPSEPAWGQAALALGRIAVAQGDLGEALTRFEQAARWAMDRDDAALEAAAREGLIDALGRGELHDADARFARIAGTRGERRREDMKARLAERLAQRDRLIEADDLLVQLSDGQSHDRCMHRARLVQVRRLRGQTTTTARALDALLDEVEALPVDHRLRDRCSALAAELAVSIASSWHADALQRRDEQLMYLGAHVYQGVLATFSQRALDRWGVCTSLSDVAYGRAELLLGQRRWDDCGEAYDLAIRYDPRGSRAEDAAFSAVVCRRGAWTDTQRLRPKMPADDRMIAALQHDQAWRSLLRAIHRYLCMAESSQRGTRNYAESAYARAQAFYEGGALWESAVAFRMLAFDDGDALATSHAAMRYAQVMEDLAADDACRHELTRDVEKLVAIHCARASSEACRGMRDVLGRLHAHKPQL